MTVVVLDTNSFPHGHYSERALLWLVETASRGASIVVPEVVVWEWAEHAHSAQVALTEVVRLHRVDPKVFSVPPVSDAQRVEDVVTRIEGLLSGHVEVWSAPDEATRDALRQQVLQIGSGERKREVKTGAADALVLACVGEQVDTAEGAVVLLTSDKRLRESCRRMFQGVLLASGTGELLERLNEFEPAAEDLALRAEETLTEYLNVRISEEGESLPFDELGFVLQGVENADPPGEISSMALHHVDIVEIHGFKTTRNEQGRFGLANLRIFGDVYLTIIEQRETSVGVERIHRVVGPLSMAYVDVTVAIKWNHNWQLEGVSPTGIAVIAFPGDDDDSDDDEVDFHASAADPGQSPDLF